jgi:TRAP-type uncharacterized transport system substrate-binding protein
MMNTPARPRWLAAGASAQRRFAVGAILLSAGTLFALGGTVLPRAWKPRTSHVQMVVDLNPARAMLAETIAAAGKEHGLEIGLSVRALGSLEAIDLIDQPSPIDLALVPGGVTPRTCSNVRQVLVLGAESLHLLVRAELADAGLAGLRGRRINLGPSSAACHHIARDVLAFAGLRCTVGKDGNGKDDYQVDESSPQELKRRLDRFCTAAGADRDRAAGALPDAVFLLSMFPSSLARALVSTAGYRLVPLPFTDAYRLDRNRSPEAGEVRIDGAQLFAIEIPAWLYGNDPPVPATPCRTIATRLVLLAHATTDDEAVARLAETLYDSAVADLANPVALGDQVPYFPFHPGTVRYRLRSQPTSGTARAASPGTIGGGLLAFALGIGVAYCFFRFRQVRRFESYYHEVRRVEMIARGWETDPHAPADKAARRRYLDDRLLALKSRVFRDFAEGHLRGESLLSGIISLVNDTRNSLERISALDEPPPPSTSAAGRLPSGKDAADGRN